MAPQFTPKQLTSVINGKKDTQTVWIVMQKAITAFKKWNALFKIFKQLTSSHLKLEINTL